LQRAGPGFFGESTHSHTRPICSLDTLFRSDGAGGAPVCSDSKTTVGPSASCTSSQATARQSRACHNGTGRRAAEQPKKWAAAGSATLPHCCSSVKAGEHLLCVAHQHQRELVQQLQQRQWEFEEQREGKWQRPCKQQQEGQWWSTAGGRRPGALLREPRQHATEKSPRSGLWSLPGTEGQLPQRRHL